MPDVDTIGAALLAHGADRGHDTAVRDLLPRAARAPGLARRLREAGIDPSAPAGAADLDRLPVLTKDEVRAAQEADPPFAGLLPDPSRAARLFQSPGPLYEPQLLGPDPWRWGQALSALGVGSGDVVLNCFGYHLTPAGAMFDEAARSLGARVVPGGIGNQDLQARAIADLGVTAYTGLPSYLNALIERYDALGLPADAWRLTRALVTAEPLPDSLRDQVRRRVPHVRSSYGTAETGLIAYEDDAGEGMALADGVIVQVCDLDTGAPLTDESRGQVVVTVLREDYPLVRFGTGDLSAWTLAGGRPRLRGVLGRVGAAVKVRGLFLHPAQTAPVLAAVEGVADHRFVVSRVDHRDDLRCEVVPRDERAAADLGQRVEDAVRAGLRFRCTVAVVAAIEDGQSGAIVDERTWE